MPISHKIVFDFIRNEGLQTSDQLTHSTFAYIHTITSILLKVAGSIPDEVIGFSGHTMALGSTQPLTEMIKQYYDRPGQALWVPGGSGSQISRQSAHEGDKVVSLTHRPPLPPRKYSWYSFLLEAESILGP